MRKHDDIIGVVLASFIFCGLLLAELSGCQHSQPVVISTGTVVSTGTGTATSTGLTPDQLAVITQEVTGVGSDAVDIGLTAWAQQNNAVATEVAQAIHANAAEIQAYLNGGNLPSADLVLAFIKSSIGKKLPPLVQLGLTGASLVLDRFFTIPNVPLSANQLAIVSAFIGALDSGAQAYLAAPPPIGTPMKAKNERAVRDLLSNLKAATKPKVNLGKD